VNAVGCWFQKKSKRGKSHNRARNIDYLKEGTTIHTSSALEATNRFVGLFFSSGLIAHR
jgi:hypothetical protein